MVWAMTAGLALVAIRWPTTGPLSDRPTIVRWRPCHRRHCRFRTLGYVFRRCKRTPWNGSFAETTTASSAGSIFPRVSKDEIHGGNKRAQVGKPILRWNGHNRAQSNFMDWNQYLIDNSRTAIESSSILAERKHLRSKRQIQARKVYRYKREEDDNTTK